MGKEPLRANDGSYVCSDISSLSITDIAGDDAGGCNWDDSANDAVLEAGDCSGDDDGDNDGEAVVAAPPDADVNDLNMPKVSSSTVLFAFARGRNKIAQSASVTQVRIAFLFKPPHKNAKIKTTGSIIINVRNPLDDNDVTIIENAVTAINSDDAFCANTGQSARDRMFAIRARAAESEPGCAGRVCFRASRDCGCNCDCACGCDCVCGCECDCGCD